MESKKIDKKIIFLIFFFLFSFNFSYAYQDKEIKVISRSSWEEGSFNFYYLNELKDTIFEYKRIIIHDTGCCSSLAYKNPEKFILMIRNYHIKKGFGDIGYNFLIDPYGNIYEGRKGVGAHTYSQRYCLDFNKDSIGIALLGEYKDGKIPKEALNSLTKLVGFLSYNKNLNPLNLNVGSFIEKDVKTKQGCVISRRSKLVKFYAPVVVGHKEIELGNSDPAGIKMDEIRKLSHFWYQKFNEFTQDNDKGKGVLEKIGDFYVRNIFSDFLSLIKKVI